MMNYLIAKPCSHDIHSGFNFLIKKTRFAFGELILEIKILVLFRLISFLFQIHNKYAFQ